MRLIGTQSVVGTVVLCIRGGIQSPRDLCTLNYVCAATFDSNTVCCCQGLFTGVEAIPNRRLEPEPMRRQGSRSTSRKIFIQFHYNQSIVPLSNLITNYPPALASSFNTPLERMFLIGPKLKGNTKCKT